MAEIKHTFTAGRMNKDLDERLIPNGEYRDALNIQVRTTDGDAAGTIQNLQGNVNIGNTTYRDEILPNSDFSQGNLGWIENDVNTSTNWLGSDELDPQYVLAGSIEDASNNASAGLTPIGGVIKQQLVASSIGTSHWFISDLGAIDEGQWSFSVWVKPWINNGSSNCDIVLAMEDNQPGGDISEAYTASDNGSWQRYTITRDIIHDASSYNTLGLVISGADVGDTFQIWRPTVTEGTPYTNDYLKFDNNSLTVHTINTDYQTTSSEELSNWNFALGDSTWVGYNYTIANNQLNISTGPDDVGGAAFVHQPLLSPSSGNVTVTFSGTVRGGELTIAGTTFGKGVYVDEELSLDVAKLHKYFSIRVGGKRYGTQAEGYTWESGDTTIDYVSVKELTSNISGVNGFQPKGFNTIKGGETYRLDYEISKLSGSISNIRLVDGTNKIPLVKSVGKHSIDFTSLDHSQNYLKFEVSSISDPEAYVTFNSISLKNISENVSTSKCVGSIANGKDDKAYFLFAGDNFNSSDPFLVGTETKYIDHIVEQDINGNTVNVFNDVFGIAETAEKAGIASQVLTSPFDEINVKDGSKYRVGMTVKVLNTLGENLLEPDTKVLKVIGDTIHLDKVQNVTIGTEVCPDKQLVDANEWIIYENTLGDVSFETADINDVSVSGVRFHSNTVNTSGSYIQNASVVNTATDYTLKYSVKENNSVDSLKFYLSDEWVSVPNEVGEHSIKFNSGGSAGGTRPFGVGNFEESYPLGPNVVLGQSSHFQYGIGAWREQIGTGGIHPYGDPLLGRPYAMEYKIGGNPDVSNSTAMLQLRGLGIEPNTDYQVYFQLWHSADATFDSAHTYSFLVGSGIETGITSTTTPTYKGFVVNSGTGMPKEIRLYSNFGSSGMTGSFFISNVMVMKYNDIASGDIFLNQISLTSESTTADVVTWEAPKILDFNQSNLITGINIIDDLLLWTDGVTEPKKVNISRSKAGTAGTTDQTKLYLNTPQGLQLASSLLPEDSPNLIYHGDFPSLYVPLNWGGHNTSAAWDNGMLKVRNTSPSATDGWYAFSDMPYDKGIELHSGVSYKLTADAYIETGYSVQLEVVGEGFSNKIHNDGTLEFEFTPERSKSSAVVRVWMTGGDDDFVKIDNISLSVTNSGVDDYVSSEHITVIKKAPNRSPYVNIITSEDLGLEDWLVNDFTDFVDSEYNTPFAPGSVGSVTGESLPPFKPGDAIQFTSTTSVDEELVVSCRVTKIVVDRLYYIILAIDQGITSNHDSWVVNVLEPLSIFENRFCRLACRYKYNDGEYSTISPWSSLLFEPGDFEFKSDNGHNSGMVNRAKSIEVSNLINSSVPEDVDSIDILFGSTDSTTMYVLKTISKATDPEWKSDLVEITTEMMHRSVPENQIFRVWDEVPTSARAQEIIGNRVVYGNYTQGYDIPFVPSLEQSLTSNPITANSPSKSVKSSRSYKIGVVFEDVNGRQSTILSTSDRLTKTDAVSKSESGVTTVSKSSSSSENKLTVKQNWDTLESEASVPEPWMESVRYYVKEGSNDYYNLAMDRWYNAEDGNIWVSFLSSDRNKLSEESYISLKKTHGSDQPVVNGDSYKVLAISNEAPDFIKTYRKTIGNLDIPSYGGDSYYNHSNGVTPSLSLNDELRIEHNAYKAFNPSDSTIKAEGNLKVRLVAHDIANNITITTSYVEVNYFKQPTNDGDEGSLKLHRQFGDEGDLYKQFVTRGYYSTYDAVKAVLSDATTGSITYELVEEIVENKPEFDGKFFVKINRDEDITSNVLNNGESVSLFTSVGTLSLGFVDSKVDTATGKRDAEVYSPDAYIWGTNAATNYAQGIQGTLEILANPLDKEQVRYMGGASFTGIYSQFWEFYNEWATYKIDYTYYPGSGPGSVNGFIDGAGYLAYEDGSWVVKSKDALRSANGAVDNSLNVIDIALPPSNNPWTSKRDGSAYESLFKLGAIFSFSKDPDQIKYRVSGIKYPQGPTSNYGGVSQGLVPISIDNDFYAERTVYTLTFERLNGNGDVEANQGIDVQAFDPRRAIANDGTERMDMEVYTAAVFTEDTTDISKVGNEGIWETQPVELVDSNLYYEASNSIPLFLSPSNIDSYAPLNSKVIVRRLSGGIAKSDVNYNVVNHNGLAVLINSDSDDFEGRSYGIYNDYSLEFIHPDGTVTRAEIDEVGSIDPEDGTFTAIDRFEVNVTRGDANNKLTTSTTAEWDDIEVGAVLHGAGGPLFYENTYVVSKTSPDILTLNKHTKGAASNTAIWVYNYGGAYKLKTDVYKQTVDLPWFNCYSFGNGVESNRIRDDYGAPMIGSGFKASLVKPSYSKEYKSSGLIYSGIYNSTSSTNKLNEFNAGVKITKDINPSYGSIQALKSRDTNLQVFTEDRVLKVLANKDALYNADGNTNITSTDSVLGQAIPYIGDFGISKNPESLAHDQYRSYFVDKQRGAVIRLSNDGLTPISNVGMKTWFRDNLRDAETAVGDYDAINGEYNLTIKPDRRSQLKPTTISFNEASKGWVSFKSYIPDSSVSISGKFLTANGGKIWEHYSDNVDRNTFYEDHGDELIQNGYFNEDLRGWDFGDGSETNAFKLVSRSADSPGTLSPTMHINGLKSVTQTGAVSQDVSKRTVRGKKYEVSFDYYIKESSPVGHLHLVIDSGAEYNKVFMLQNEWIRYSFIFDSPDKMFKGISFHGDTDRPVYAYIANVSVREYHENFTASKFTTVLNDIPGSIKSFKTINYEGSEGKSINVNNMSVQDINGNDVTANDGLYNLLNSELSDNYGWAATISTDLQKGEIVNFKNKEGKWFGNITGVEDPELLNPNQLNIGDLSTQGLGFAKNISAGDATEVQITITQ